MTWIPYVTMFLLMVVGLLLIFIILLQRGRGGGLAGALGGMGGTSAFGTRAGDVFTKITVVLAIIWTILAAGNVYALRITTKKYTGASVTVPTAPAMEQGAGGGDTTTPATGEGLPGAESKPTGESDGQTPPATTPQTPATEGTATPSAEKPAEPADKPDANAAQPASETRSDSQ